MGDLGKGLDGLWYVLYIILNVFTLGILWFVRNLITYSIELALRDNDEKIKTKVRG